MRRNKKFAYVYLLLAFLYIVMVGEWVGFTMFITLGTASLFYK